MQRQLAALRDLGRLVLRRPSSSPGVALLQGPLGVRCHGSILRTIAEHLGPFPKATRRFAPCNASPPSFSIGDTPPGTYSKTVSLCPADLSWNVTLSRYSYDSSMLVSMTSFCEESRMTTWDFITALFYHV